MPKRFFHTHDGGQASVPLVSPNIDHSREPSGKVKIPVYQVELKIMGYKIQAMVFRIAGMPAISINGRWLENRRLWKSSAP
jgi:hypothetical protein